MDAEADVADGAANSTRRAGARLGTAGFAVMLLLAAWLYGIAADHPWREATITILLTYSVIVIAFVAGIRWGAALLTQGETGHSAGMAVALLPVLTALAALLIAPPHSFAVLAVAFAAQGAWDALAAHRGDVPVWFGAQRRWLTLLAVGAMIAAFAATA